MKIAWDPTAQRDNLREHGIEFAFAVGVFHDRHALSIEDWVGKERRSVTIGRDAFGRTLVVEYQHRQPDTFWILAARKAGEGEIRQYLSSPASTT
ncbi:MAG: BrnT family toxin [Sphingobacteriia bacterium]|nr:BrnT family toxin [Sphingobacteriia bacterium]NCC39907.1 BrnT family toxin [Gammaproteobacteria bacterium]